MIILLIYLIGVAAMVAGMWFFVARRERGSENQTAAIVLIAISWPIILVRFFSKR